jgi:signal transduction histidine kinase
VTILRDDDGHVSANGADVPVPGLADVSGLVAESRGAGLAVRLDNRVVLCSELSAAVGRTAYRVIQEALTNARKHAPEESVVIVVDGAPGRRLTIDVCNRLPGRVPSHQPPGTGTGLIGLTERVQLTGGCMEHEVNAAGEFHLHAWLPWK